MKISDVLEQIMKEPHLHARWLNSLSYLEYRGFRKIVRSQSTEEMCHETLTHTLEEIRHALFFKRQAMRVGGADFAFYTEPMLLCPQALKAYFYDIDSEVASTLQSYGLEHLARAAYYVVTYLVEVRALTLYREYQSLLEKGNHGISLAALLREEGQHLEAVGAATMDLIKEFPLAHEKFVEIEDRHFRIFWNQITSKVQTTTATTLANCEASA